jgi:integration host factor subunit alpha
LAFQVLHLDWPGPEIFERLRLTKDKLIAQLQTQIGIPKPESRQLVEQLFEIMKSTLVDEEDLLISGFRKFHVREKNERRGRNPQTKEILMLRPRRVVMFNKSGILRGRVNVE